MLFPDGTISHPQGGRGRVTDWQQYVRTATVQALMEMMATSSAVAAAAVEAGLEMLLPDSDTAIRPPQQTLPAPKILLHLSWRCVLPADSRDQLLDLLDQLLELLERLSRSTFLVPSPDPYIRRPC